MRKKIKEKAQKIIIENEYNFILMAINSSIDDLKENRSIKSNS